MFKLWKKVTTGRCDFIFVKSETTPKRIILSATLWQTAVTHCLHVSALNPRPDSRDSSRLLQQLSDHKDKQEVQRLNRDWREDMSGMLARTHAHTCTYVHARYLRRSSLLENDNELPGVQITASVCFMSNISSVGIFGWRPLAWLLTKVFLLASRISCRSVFEFSVRMTGEIIVFKVNY